MLSRDDNELITRTGPGTPMGELFRRFWQPALLPSELPLPDCSPVRLRLLGEDLVAFRDSTGQVGVLTENCPHRGASLFFGRNEECGLRCVYHGWKFDADGACLDMPNEPPESNFKDRVRITAYPAREWGGLIWVFMGPPDRLADLPELAWALVPDTHRYIAKISTDCNYLQALEGDFDSSHSSFLHGSLAGAPDAPFRERLSAGSGRPNPGLTERTVHASDTAPRFEMRETDYGLMYATKRDTGDGRVYCRVQHWLMPAHALIAAGSGESTRTNIRVPIDDGRSWHFRIQYNLSQPLTEEELVTCRESGLVFPELIPGSFRPVQNRDNDYLIDRDAQRTSSMTGIKSITQQDRAVTESMGPIADRTREHLGASDSAIIAVRRRLLREAQALQAGVEPSVAGDGSRYRVRAVAARLDPQTRWESLALEPLDASRAIGQD